MPPKVYKKRGRKPKNKKLENTEPKVRKKRGRKPKGGKIIKPINEKTDTIEIKQPNIILQLKCSTKDIDNDNNIINLSKYEKKHIEAFNISNNKQNSIQYEQYDNIKYNISNKKDNNIKNNTDKNNTDENIIDIKCIWEKLELLKVKLHLNDISDKHSNCFWCTCNFDNPPIYIPKHQLNGTYEVYGCFCSPECACGYLFKQANLNTSTKFERYHLLNNIYCKIYDYKRNIKPAPNPYYTLDKFYGNLNIQEYRQLLKNERVLLVVDKPLSRSLPELHEDNGEFMINSKSLSANNTYKLRRSKKRQTKSELLMSNFNLK